MPGTNAGTGHPLSLRCALCRRHDWRDRSTGFNLSATGRTSNRARRGGIRTTSRRIEYECGDCGHIGWTIHADAERLLSRVDPQDRKDISLHGQTSTRVDVA